MTDTDPPPTPDHEGMVRCEITGQWVSQEEIVTIQGHRVCAEGKAELLERLRSGELMPGELERPGVWRRVGCMILDNLLLGLLWFLGVVLLGGPQALATSPESAWQLVNFLIVIVYFTLMHGGGGQTLGKMAGRIRVVRGDGSPIDLRVAFLRIIYLLGPSFLGTGITVLGGMLQSAPVQIAGQIVNGLGSVYWLASGVAALIDSDQQRSIHDRLAGTRVIWIR